MLRMEWACTKMRVIRRELNTCIFVVLQHVQSFKVVESDANDIIHVPAKANTPSHTHPGLHAGGIDQHFHFGPTHTTTPLLGKAVCKTLSLAVKLGPQTATVKVHIFVQLRKAPNPNLLS